MGMGDQKPPYESRGEPILDNVSGKMFSHGCVRRCPHPGVISKFGVGGKANVSVYTCRKCRFHESVKWIGGSKCRYETETLNG